jgi:hypothetical protein
MTPLITKQQIAAYEVLSENIDDDLINPHILDAQQFDTIPVMPDALLRAIEVQILSKIQQWNKNKNYTIGDAVWYGNERRFYKATSANSNSLPPSGDWANFELMNFYETYLVPFLAYSFYYRFFAYHGINVTQYGTREMVEETSREITDRRRADKLGDLRNKISMVTIKMSKALSSVNNTFDGVAYPFDSGESTRLKPKVQIFQLGGRHKTSKRKWDSQ